MIDCLQNMIYNLHVHATSIAEKRASMVYDTFKIPYKQGFTRLMIAFKKSSLIHDKLIYIYFLKVRKTRNSMIIKVYT